MATATTTSYGTGTGRGSNSIGVQGGTVAEPNQGWAGRFAQIPAIYAVAIAIVIGDAAGNWKILAPESLAVALGLISALAFYVRRRALGLMAAYAALACVATISPATLLDPPYSPDSIRNFADGSTATIAGIVIREPERERYGDRIYVKVERAGSPNQMRAAAGQVRVAVLGGDSFHLGDEVQLTAPIRFPRNDGNPGEFDYAGFLSRDGVDATMTVRPDSSGTSSIRVVGSRSFFPASEIGSIRERIGVFIDRNLSYPENAEMRALVIGDRSGIRDDLRDTFAHTGMAHLLVISGLHLSLVAAAIFAVVRLLLMLAPGLANRGYANKLAAMAASLGVCAYAAIAGHRVSTTRALVMVLAYMFAIIIDRARAPIASLALAAIVICIAIPGSTADIGFQLSFVSVIAIVLGMKRFMAWFERRKRWGTVLGTAAPIRWRLAEVPASVIAVSFWAMVATAPLTALHFNQVAIVGLAANAVVVPIMGFGATISGLVAAVLSFISEPLARLILNLGAACIGWGNSMAQWFSGWPLAWSETFTPTVVELALVYGLIFVWLTAPIVAPTKNPHLQPLTRDPRKWNAADVDRALPGWRTLCAGALGVLLAADATWWTGDRYFSPDLRVTYLSVGEGDAAVVRFPGSRVMLIDAGGAYPGFDSGERIVAPYLRSRKIMSVDYLVLTHPDADHFGGFKYIAENFHPKTFWEPPVTSTDKTYDELMAELVKLAIPISVVSGDPPITEIGSVDLASLNRAAPGASNNNSSLVMRMAFGGTSFLFTGDIEAPAEHTMIGNRADLRATVLKVPHHGSSTSSTAEFIAAVKPEIAVISDGYLNRFHFPAAEVVDRYRTSGAILVRTDEDGAVMVDATQDSASVRTWRGKSWRFPSVRAAAR
ncbi:MAG TPA: DNA internalization-related competence protein ComEC/Rec2 [Candidatus Binataceae bacterium]|nr:DNA internalization-related competence protein ComEC/Rec2 [Candidatus Binataceae bacterium]